MRDKALPLIVASALFMENMDSTIIATSLPAIAADVGTSPLTLKLAITSYLLSLAIFIPASGWAADRFGSRNVFTLAIAIFMAGSIGCALANSLTGFVIARTLQGMGGAMMTPVGRLIMLRSVDRAQLVSAMNWVTIPGLIGPLIGPPIGGFITTFFSWHWIFLVNIPIGLIGIACAYRFIDQARQENVPPFDLVGFLLAGIGVAGLAFGLSVAGLALLPWEIVASLIGTGALAMVVYVLHARRVSDPVLDFSLFRLQTMRSGLTGGFMFRIGIGALPFLLPLLMQLGFGLNPFDSGLVTFASAIGAIGVKPLTLWILRRFGFRNVIVANALINAALIAICALFVPGVPLLLISAVLAFGGFFRSLQFTATNTLVFADVPPEKNSRASVLFSVAQQLAISAGIATGAAVVELSLYARGSDTIGAVDFAPAFLVVAVVVAASLIPYLRLPHDAGSQMSGQRSKASDAEQSAQVVDPRNPVAST